MKKRMMSIGLAAAVMAVGVGVMSGCREEADATQYVTVAFSRPSTSGTYGAFNELVKSTSENKTIAAAIEGGNEFAACVQTSQENGTVITDVSNNKNSLGYVSLGLVEANASKIKAVQVNGVDATVANIENGTYKLARPFNLIYDPNKELSDLAQNFLDFIDSSAGQTCIKKEYIGQATTVKEYTPYSGTLTTLTLIGSTSVQPLMNEEIIPAFKAANPGKNFTINCSGSGSGQGESDYTNDGVDFGMLSRATKVAADLVTVKTIALDGIAVIVQKDVALTNVTMDQLYDLYLKGTRIECK